MDDMANPKVWVSTTGNVAVDADAPGAQWERVGTIDIAQEPEMWKHIQTHIGARRSSPRINGFYLHGSPSSEWVLRARDHPDHIGSFWIAIDPLGDGTRYLVTVAQASVGTLARRPTESHPGLLARAITLGIRLQEVERRIFNVHPDE
jgi:hypothetical protein